MNCRNCKGESEVNDRYERLFSLPKNLYTSKAPVIILAGALLKDHQTGNVLAQLKFNNLSLKMIEALSVQIKCFNIIGEELQGTEYQYLDLSAARHSEFGQRTAIQLPDNTTRSISVVCTNVVFSDHTFWNAEESAVWDSLPNQQNLGNIIGNLAEQYCRETSSHSRFVPLEYNDLWICSCGTVNKQGDSYCCRCGIKKQQIFSALNVELLTQNREQFRAEQAQQKAIQEEKQKERNAKIKKSSLCVIITVVCLTLLNLVFLPSLHRYNLNSFSKTLQQGLEDRNLLVESFEQANTDNTIESYREYVSAETKIFSFSDTDFSDDEINKYANMYIEGLSKQKEALDYDITSDEFNTLWNNGYTERAEAILYFQRTNCINLDQDLYATFAMVVLENKNVSYAIDGQITISGEYASIVVNNDTLMDFQDVELEVCWDNNEVTSALVNKWAAGQDARFEIPIPKRVLDSLNTTHEVSIDIPAYTPGTLFSETSGNSELESEDETE